MDDGFLGMGVQSATSLAETPFVHCRYAMPWLRVQHKSGATAVRSYGSEGDCPWQRKEVAAGWHQSWKLAGPGRLPARASRRGAFSEVAPRQLAELDNQSTPSFVHGQRRIEINKFVSALRWTCVRLTAMDLRPANCLSFNHYGHIRLLYGLSTYYLCSACSTETVPWRVCLRRRHCSRRQSMARASVAKRKTRRCGIWNAWA
jgi:hypothetical protein